MKDEAMFYWVCGHLFGWTEVKESMYIMDKDRNGIPIRINHTEDVRRPKYIRFCQRKYQFWDLFDLCGQWSLLGGNIRRDMAFEYFQKNILSKYKDALHDKILYDLNWEGRKHYTSLIHNIITGGLADYIDKILCTNKCSSTYCTKKHRVEWEFILKEWDYIEANLLNALENFK